MSGGPRSVWMDWLLGMVGAVAGATVGALIFHWLVTQGFYAMILPGACIGLGCGWLAKRPSFSRGLVCLVLAFPFSLVIEHHYFPMIADDSLSYFLQNLHDIHSVHILMILLGSASALWFGRGR